MFDCLVDCSCKLRGHANISPKKSWKIKNLQQESVMLIMIHIKEMNLPLIVFQSDVWCVYGFMCGNVWLFIQGMPS